MRFLKAVLPTLAAMLVAGGVSYASLYKWSQTANSNATADSTINWAEGMAPSAVNDSARAMMAAVAKYRDDISGKLVTAGTSTAYTIASNQVFSTLAAMDGAELSFRMSTTSGAAPTLNVDGLGGKALNQATGVAVATGALTSGAIYRATYVNASNEWIVQGIAGTIPSGTTMMSMSTACPAGWTIQSGVTADKGFRLSTSAGGGTGGSVAFTTAMASTGSYTLQIADMPSHSHAAAGITGSLADTTLGITTRVRTMAQGASTSFSVAVSNVDSTGADGTVSSGTMPNGSVNIGGTSSAAGGGGGHGHTINLAYVDLIGCTKN